MKLNADLKIPAHRNIHDIDWEATPSNGVHRRRLECDDDTPPVERVTTIVRFAAGSAFKGHVHGGGEEFLVLEGVFSDQHADYPEGYYVRNPVGTGHAPHSDEGCTILVKLWQMRKDDQAQLSINTHDKTLWQRDDLGIETLPLFNSDYETVCMLKWPAGSKLETQSFEGGVEYFILQGTFKDEHGTHNEGTWLRLPPGSQQNIQVIEDCRVYRKTGHLNKPVPYEQQ